MKYSKPHLLNIGAPDSSLGQLSCGDGSQASSCETGKSFMNPGDCSPGSTASSGQCVDGGSNPQSCYDGNSPSTFPCQSGAQAISICEDGSICCQTGDTFG